MGFEDPAGFGALALVEGNKEPFRKQLADRERFRAFSIKVFTPDAPFPQSRP